MTGLEKSLRQRFESHIFTRGVRYFQGGQVDSVSARAHKANPQVISITGVVLGSDDYMTHLSFAVDQKEFLQDNCSCPYGAACKHAAALGLAFIKLYEACVQYKVNAEGREDTLGYGDGSVSPADLVTWVENIDPAIPLTEVATVAVIKSKLPLTEYVRIVIDCSVFTTQHTLSFAVEKKEKPHQAVNLAVLKSSYPQCSKEEKKILTILTELQKAASFYQRQNKDLVYELLQLLQASDFAVYVQHGKKPVPVVWAEQADMRPNLNIIEEVAATGEYKFLSLQVPELSYKRNCLLVEKGGMILIQDTKILVVPVKRRARTLLHDLVGHLRRLNHPYYNNSYRVQESNALRIPEKYLPDMSKTKRALSQHFTVHCENDYQTRVLKVGESSLQVHYDKEERKLLITPVVRYDDVVVDLSEKYVFSQGYYGYSDSLHQRVFGQFDGETNCLIEGDKITCLVPDDKQEKAFLKYILRQREVLDINKKLRCRRRGKKQLHDFTVNLLPVYEKAKYPLTYTKDKLQYVEASVEAKLIASTKTEEEWLDFDYSFYCGQEKITLQDLVVYLESGEDTLTLSNGAEITVKNKVELERLVKLLLLSERSAQSSGQGKVARYHAPAIEALAAESENISTVFDAKIKKFLKQAKSGTVLKAADLAKMTNKMKGIELRDYQYTGVSFLQFLHTHALGGILADDMGLGKTLQTLLLISTARKKADTSIVVAPKTLLYNWQEEAKKFTPHLSVLVIDGLPEERAEMIKTIKKYDLIITSYSQLQKDIEKYEELEFIFSHIVLDEAQYIKNHRSKNSTCVGRLVGRTKVALSGTPMENRLSELWSIYNFVLPGLLGSHKSFRKDYEIPVSKKGDVAVLKHLKNIIAPFILRRSKAEVLTELPATIDSVKHCHLESEQSVLYQDVLTRVRNDLDNVVAEKGFNKAQIEILAALTKLRQICNHPHLLVKEGDYTDYQSAKLAMALELIDGIQAAGKKVLVFSQFVTMLDIIEAELKLKKIGHQVLTGKTKNRKTVINNFIKDEDTSVFLISLKVGSTGLNLTAADNVIIFDPWWNPSVEMQAIGRAHRIGQTKAVNVYRLITLGTIEEKIVALQNKKKNLFDATITENEAQLSSLTWDDIRNLLK